MNKTFSAFFLLLVLLSCEKEEEFNIYSYDGEYPRNMDGSRIKTYNPEVKGEWGEIDIQFNGHPWNHAPYVGRNISGYYPSQTVTGEREVGVSIYSLLTNTPVEPCVSEQFSLHVPLKPGRVDLNQRVKMVPPQEEYRFAKFISVNCDAGKDRYGLNLDKASTANVISFDETTNKLEVWFDVYFKIKTRNSDFGPIYPTHIHLRGTVKGTVEWEPAPAS